ncbi:MAG: hypothetical protein C0625_00370 [Arcobacter sp.]|nr:MAG: hypothetical protein C0625_00370 [Arcobacter sp.]
MNALNYVSFFENINSFTPINEYEKVLDTNAKFKDPFHEVVGIEKIYFIFQDMYLKLDEPKFKIKEVVEQNNIAYIKWDFEFSFKNNTKEESFEGVSRVEFNEKGKAISHIDYWDTAENLYEKIPILSSFIKFIKRKIKS